MKELITLACLYCKKQKDFDADSLTGNGTFNFFCDNECEDRYSATL